MLKCHRCDQTKLCRYKCIKRHSDSSGQIESWIVCCDCWKEWNIISNKIGYHKAKQKYDVAVSKFMGLPIEDNVDILGFYGKFTK